MGLRKPRTRLTLRICYSEALVASGEVDEGIAGDVPKPMDPMMAVMGILWRVQDVLKEADTRM